MRKHYKLLIIIVFVMGFLVVLDRQTELLYPIRVTCSAFLSSVDLLNAKKAGVRSVEIKLSEEVQAHFKNLYKDYHGNNFEGELQAGYKRNNQWKDAVLNMDGNDNPVLVRSHGKSPTDHKYGQHFSLAIKFKEAPYPFYDKRINLVVYNRVQISNSILDLFATKFNLMHPSFEVVVGHENGKDPNLYYVEERINKAFFRQRKLPMINVKKGKKKHKESAQQFAQQCFIELKIAIQENNIEAVSKFLDEDYISRMMAFRKIYGAYHGFNEENLKMGFDTLHHKFYPIVHRDVISSKVQGQYFDSFPLFDLLSKDKDYQKLVSDHLAAFLKSNPSSQLEFEVKAIQDKYKLLFNFESSYCNNGHNGWIVLDNISQLRKAFKQENSRF